MTPRGVTMDPPAQPRAARPRPRRTLRRIARWTLLLFLLGVIAGYWTITDPDRVRSMAEMYLSQISGGQVRVGRANLSIFEGLRLEGVRVFVDNRELPDSLLFEAQTFHVRADLRKLLAGRLESTQITALRPQVYLCEDVDHGRWNYERLTPRPRPPRQKPPKPTGPVFLPEVFLRGGMVHYSRIIDHRYRAVGSMAIDGQLAPAGEEASAGGARYAFDLDSRFPGEPTGPRVRGIVDPSRPSIQASLEDLEFERDVKFMLPAQVQAWWNAHQLAGRLRVPRFRYVAAPGTNRTGFEIEVELQDVRMVVPPQELMGRSDLARQKRFRPGFPVAAASPFKLIGQTDAVAQVMQPLPVSLRNVSGRIRFTPEGIRLSGLSGVIEGNRVRIDGSVKGYDLDKGFQLRLIADNLYIPPAPRFVQSLPAQARREYAKFRPGGRGRLGLELRQAGPRDYLEARMELHILDGSFCFEEFAYPLHHMRGVVAFGRDPAQRADWVLLRDMTGYGTRGTANENTHVRFSGWFAPLRRFSGVELNIQSENVVLDSTLRRALPPDVRDVMDHFDEPALDPAAPPTPVYLRGDLRMRLSRQRGTRRLIPDAVLAIRDGRGAFSEFPYPLRNVAGTLLIRGDSVGVNGLMSRHGDSWLKLDGEVLYGKDRPVQPVLRILARHVPIDASLIRATPEEQRRWIIDLGMGGWLDVDGRIFLAHRRSRDAVDPALQAFTRDNSVVDFNLDIAVNEGHLWNIAGAPAITDVAGGLKITRSGLDINWANGKRGDATLTGKGRFNWEERPSFSLEVDARNLLADQTTYAMLPEGGSQWWDQLRLSGRANVQVRYSGGLEDNSPEGATPDSEFSVVIQPRGLGVYPLDVPWRMNAIGGELRIVHARGAAGEDVTLHDIILAHGEASLTLNGRAASSSSWTQLARSLVASRLAWQLDPLENQPWDLRLSARNLTADAELLDALPADLAGPLRSVEFKGNRLSLDLSRIRYRSTDLSARSMLDRGSPVSTEFELQGRIGLEGASLNIGLPLADVRGSIDLNARAIDGKLHALSGPINLTSLTVAGRPARDLRVSFIKREGRSEYQFRDLRANIAGGLLAGQVDLATDANRSRYGLSLVFNDLNIQDILSESASRLKGKLRASISLAGFWDDPRSRRGGGDVRVQGQNLYSVPVPFGLLQILNLSLPIRSPFTEASMRYSVDGQRMLMRDVELRAQHMLMQGSGVADFGAMTVEMVFTPNNPNWPTIEPLDNLKRDLFQIRVTGKILDPTVSPRAMNTFTTTVDQVLRGEPPSSPKKKDSDNKGKLW